MTTVSRRAPRPFNLLAAAACARGKLLALVAAMLVAVVLVTPMSASAAGSVVGEEDHKGLGPNVPVPSWAKSRAVHFFPWAETASAVGPKTRVGPKGPGEASGSTEGESPLFYFGGIGVQHSSTVYPIFWGSNWNREPGSAVRTQVMKMYEGLSGTAFQGILTQYFDSTGRISSTVGVSPAYTDESVAAPTEVTYANIDEEVARAIAAKQWAHNLNNQFVVLTAPGSTYHITGYCAYHEYVAVDATNIPVSVSFVPYEGDPPLAEHCLVRDPEENAGNVTSAAAAHEYAESATDPGGQANGTWRSNDALHEIADMCNTSDARLPNGTYAQPLWDDHQSECSTSDAAPPHVLGLTGAATEVGLTNGVLHGTVNPEGIATTYYFQYGPTKSYGSRTLGFSAGSGLNNQAVSQAIGGLPHGTEYHFRIVATNSTGTTYGEDKHFQTTQEPPIVTTTAATGVTTSGATLHGTVNPNGLETKYHFEYSASELELRLGNGTKTSEVGVGAGTSTLEVSQALTGLASSTEYYFKITASNNDGTVSGSIGHFFTGPPQNTALPVTSPTVPDQAVPESTTNGSWKGEPTSYKYQWERCKGACEEWKAIESATKSTYTPIAGDVGYMLRSKVTAENSLGATSAYSKASGTVKPIGELTEYSLPSGNSPVSIVTGPDNNLWFTSLFNNKIGKITPEGAVTQYSLPAESSPTDIAVGPGDIFGNLWFTNKSKIGRINPGSGVITEYAIGANSWAEAITSGPDGNMWFTAPGADKIGKITASGVVTEYSVPPGESYENRPYDITSGPDGNLWFTIGRQIDKITTSGVITKYMLPSKKFTGGITVGPDGNLWYTAAEGGIGTEKEESAIGKITTAGAITEYGPLPAGSSPVGITAGADGNLWFTCYENRKLDRITTSGVITEFTLPSGTFLDDSGGITTGPDKNIWFTNYGLNKIGKITP